MWSLGYRLELITNILHLAICIFDLCQIYELCVKKVVALFSRIPPQQYHNNPILAIARCNLNRLHDVHRTIDLQTTTFT